MIENIINYPLLNWRMTISHSSLFLHRLIVFGKSVKPFTEACWIQDSLWFLSLDFNLASIPKIGPTVCKSLLNRRFTQSPVPRFQYSAFLCWLARIAIIPKIGWIVCKSLLNRIFARSPVPGFWYSAFLCWLARLAGIPKISWTVCKCLLNLKIHSESCPWISI